MFGAFSFEQHNAAIKQHYQQTTKKSGTHKDKTASRLECQTYRLESPFLYHRLDPENEVKSFRKNAFCGLKQFWYATKENESFQQYFHSKQDLSFRICRYRLCKLVCIVQKALNSNV